MRYQRAEAKCYYHGNGAITLLGGVLIAIGLLLLFLCIPGWAWAALGGAALIGVGLLLIRAGKSGR